MRKFLCTISSKKGSFFIPTCAIIVMVAMLLMVVLIFAQTIMIINHQRDDTRQKLDDYLAIAAINEFNAIKQGTVGVMRTDELLANAHQIDFGDNVSNAVITLIDADGVRLQVTYDFTIEVFGQELTIPVTVTGKFIRR